MVLVAVRDLLFRSKIEAAAARLGVAIRLAPRTGRLADAARECGARVLLVDLGQPDVLDEVRAAKAAAPLRVAGFLGHLETGLMDAARAAGVDEVLTRGQFASRLDALLQAAARL
jgi:AmiR/NasT family two-component response regulator